MCLPSGCTSSRQTEQSVSPRPPVERQRNNAHALTINQDVWEKFPFRGVPFEVQVLLVNRIDEVTHGHEVSFAMELSSTPTRKNCTDGEGILFIVVVAVMCTLSVRVCLPSPPPSPWSD